MEKDCISRNHLLNLALLFLLVLVHIRAEAQYKPELYSFELDNGLRVLVNRDTTFQEIALYLTADAGFKREQAGQHGMAHLFEHVMLPTRYFHNAESVKNASQHFINSNAQVFNDYVRYYLHYDKNGLDYGLVALADRLDFQIDSLKEEALQRHINNVSSEIARAESFGSFRWRPIFRDALAKGVFGPSHPYGHEQTLPDITRSTKKDIYHWYKQWYGSSNAMLVILGNVDPVTVKQKVETYFGNISPGKQSFYPTVALPVFKEAREAYITFNQDKHVLYFAWAVPGYGSKENDFFRLLTSLLADPTTGILAKALEKAGIQDAESFSNLETYKDASVFDLGFEFVDWKDKERLTILLQEEIQNLIKNRFPSRQIAAASAQYELSFMKGMENIGQNDERIIELSLGAMFLDNPRYYEQRLDHLRKATPKQLQQVASQWLTRPSYKATIRGQQFQANNLTYNYKQSIPYKAPSAPVALSVFHKKISEHLIVHAVAQSRIPVVNFTIALENDMGLSASDIAGYKEAMRKFFETDHTFKQLQAKGLETEVKISDKTISYRASATKKQAEEVFNWLAKRLNEFLKLEIENQENAHTSRNIQTLALLKEQGLISKTAPNVYPLKKVHFIAVGDIDLKNQPFDWSSLKADKARLDSNSLSTLTPLNPATLLVKDIGESPASFIALGHFLQPATIQEEVCQNVLLHLLRAKLMNNLREKNGLAYEVYPFTTAPVGERTLAFWQTSVTIEKTAEAVKQIGIELENLQIEADREIATAKARVMADLKSKYKSLGSIENTLIENIEHDRPDDYFAKAVVALEEMDAHSFMEFLKQQAKPEHFKLVVFTSPKVVTSLTEIGKIIPKNELKE